MSRNDGEVCRNKYGEGRGREKGFYFLQLLWLTSTHCQTRTQSARKEMKWGEIIYVTQCFNYLDT